MKPTIIVSNSVQCLKCGEVIYSAHRHDFKYYKCSAVAVDGGNAYLKLSAADWSNMKELSIVLPVESVDKMIEMVTEMRESGRNDRGIVYGLLRVLRDEKLLKGFIEDDSIDQV